MKKNSQSYLKMFSCLFIIMFYANINLFSQISIDNDIPSWIILEKGKQAFINKDFGLATRLFREAVSRERDFPEAEMWLGHIFEVDGEYKLAEKQYLKAYNMKDLLYIHDDKLTIQYSLARMYLNSNMYGKYESSLLTLLQWDDNSEQTLSLRNSMMKTLRGKGIDKLVELYRFQENKYQWARSSLGIYFYRTGRYSDASINLMISTLISLSTCIDEFIRIDPDYKYKDLNHCLILASQKNRTSEYLKKTDLFKNLYYLAASLYAENEINLSKNIWKIVKNHPEAGIWSEKSGKQYFSPYIEPLLSLDKY